MECVGLGENSSDRTGDRDLQAIKYPCHSKSEDHAGVKWRPLQTIEACGNGGANRLLCYFIGIYNCVAHESLLLCFITTYSALINLSLRNYRGNSIVALCFIVKTLSETHRLLHRIGI